MVAGFYLNDVELGLSKVAERTALLINFVLIVINAVLPPIFASLYRDGRNCRIVELVKERSSARLVFNLSFVICVPFLSRMGFKLLW